MRTRFIILILAMVVYLFSSAHAQTIIWVSEWNSDSNGDPFDQDWIDLLEAQGYNVVADTTGTYETLETNKIATLNAADLVIVSRNTNSGGYIEGEEVTQWNSVETPLILLTSYLARSSRWQWIDSGAANEYAS